MQTQVLISQDANGLFYTANAAEVKSIKLYGCGRTKEEAVQSLASAYEEAKASFANRGEPLPDDLADLHFQYVYNIQHILSSLPFLNIAKLGEEIGLSPTVIRNYRVGRIYISPEREKELRDAVHEIGQRICRMTEEIVM